MMSRPPVISSRDLTMTYGNAAAPTRALDGVDLDLAPGTCAIMGPSGCGKTTLLHCLAGVTRPTSGQVHYGDRDLARLSDARRTALRRTDFGFVFQFGRLLAELPAEENVALPLLLGGLSRQQAMARARVWLERLGLAAERLRRPGELSGGQAQRVAVARALVTEPTIVFADEPTGSLDQRTGADVMDLLVGAVAATGAALLVVTHDPNVATRCARIVQLADGRIVGDHHAPGRRRPAPAQAAAPADVAPRGARR